jgi:mycothiol synthase
MGLTVLLKQTRLAHYVKRLLRRTHVAPAPPLLRMVRKLHAGEQLVQASVPDPYSQERFQPGDEARWVDVLNASGEFGRWDLARLEKEMGSTLLTDGAIFVAHQGRPVGCAAVCDVAQYRPHALLMFVAVLAEHRGHGLGQALVWETMRIARQAGYPGLLLHTENHRLAAVRLYFQLGFLPQLDRDAAGASQWSTVLGQALLGMRG